MIVRIATLDDLDSILEITKEIREEGLEKYSPLNYDDVTLRETGTFLINQGIALVGENSIGVVGFILGSLEVSVMDKKQLLGAERLWCVKKEYRGKKVGLMLLRKFEEICKFKGANLIFVSSIVSIDSDKMDGMYKKLGFTHIENHYCRKC